MGNGDVTFNSRRNLLGVISITNKVAYHLFNIDGDGTKLCRKSKWLSSPFGMKNNGKSFFSSKSKNSQPLPQIMLNKDLINPSNKYKEKFLTILFLGNYIASFDFNPQGESVAMIDCYGICAIANIDSDMYRFHLDLSWEGNTF